MALSVLVTTSASHALAVLGAFTFGRLFLWVGLFSALLAALGGLHRGRFVRFTLDGRWVSQLAPCALLGVFAAVYLPPCQYLWGDADEGVYAAASVGIVKTGGLWFQDDLLARLPQKMRELNLGILVGIAGVSILVGWDAVAGQSADLLARLALIAAPLCYVLANIFVRSRLGRYPPFVIAAMQMVGAMFVASPLALAIDRPWTLPAPSLTALGAIVGMGVLGSAFASLCHFFS